jgi:uncharacterized protein YdeI (YjbR/CyaY-like superfamily)
MNPKVDEYLSQVKQWPNEMAKLRRIILACGLTEELKWGKPCYTFQKSNVVVIQTFNDFCALLFCKGALLNDPHRILKKFGWQAARRIPFTSVREITGLAMVLKDYIHEARDKAGLKVDLKVNPEPIPAEFQNKLDRNPRLKAAFAALTPGRQRGYILYFSRAKQPKTRVARIKKCTSQILNGKGLND